MRSLKIVKLPSVDTVRSTTSQEDKIVKGNDATGTTTTDDRVKSGKAPHDDLFHESKTRAPSKGTTLLKSTVDTPNVSGSIVRKLKG